MIWLSDAALARLGSLPELPDFAGSRYRLIGELDRGGMGVVYAAEDQALGREVAIKVLRSGLLRADAALRLEREARVLAALEHPGIVPVHDTGMLPDGRAWYAMKRVRGARLDEVAASALPLADALRLFARICEPVAFAHARSVVHRDLKPENVMVGLFGEVLVMDWGVAKLLEDARPPAARSPHGTSDGLPALEPDGGLGAEELRSRRSPHGTSDGLCPALEPDGPRPIALDDVANGPRLTADGDVIGTRGYMAPEQQRGETDAISPRTDVWALGAILRDLAAAAAARDGRRLPKPLLAIIAKAKADDPAARYESAAALSADVVRFADGGRVSAYREPPWERAARWGRSNPTAVAVVAAYLVMRTLLYLWLGR